MKWDEMSSLWPKSCALLNEMYADNDNKPDPDYEWPEEAVDQVAHAEPFAASLTEEQATLFACGEEGEKNEFLQSVVPALKRSAMAADTLLNECFDGDWIDSSKSRIREDLA